MNINAKHGLAAAVLLCLVTVDGVALADRCGRNDRVPLPDCVDASHSGRKYNITNNCGFTVTVKVDIRHGDDRRYTIRPGGRERGKSGFLWSSVRSIRCCPRYNQCAPEEPSQSRIPMERNPF